MNITFSENKIVTHSEYIDNWDTWGKDTINYQNTDISFSNIIAKSQLSYDLGNLRFMDYKTYWKSIYR